MPLSRTTSLPSEELVPPSLDLRRAVDYVCDRDRAFQKIEAEAGPLTVRQRSPDFPSLVRIILGQQLASQASRAIFLRLTHLIELTPAHFADCPESALKQVGLSQAKISTCKRLAAALLSDQLSLEALTLLPNSVIVEKLTQIKGIGIWTAEIYLLFCLERLSSFPASDLAIQKGYQTLKGLDRRPPRKELQAMTTPLEPFPGAAAHLLWHYYRFLSQQTSRKAGA